MTRLPDFIIAGVRKCGTSSVHQWLGEHPQIFVPPMTKELFFFDRLWDRGPEWYMRHFRNAPPQSICGEATPTYFSHPEAAQRIKQTVPDVKLVFVFRNPVERAISMYHHMASVGETRTTFSETADRTPELIDEGFYDRHYARFASLFGEKALYPFILEDVRASGKDALKPLFAFLGVDPDFVPPSLFERTYERREPRAYGLVSFVGRTTLFLRDHGLHSVVNAAKSLGVERIFYKSNSSKPQAVTADVVARLKKNYVDDARRLGDRIGRDLVALWRLDAPDLSEDGGRDGT